MEQEVVTTDWRAIFTGVGVLVASAALFINGLNFYFQHFHKRKKLFLAAQYKSPWKQVFKGPGTRVIGRKGYWEKLVEVIITNGGDTPIVLREVELRGGVWKKGEGFGYEKDDDETIMPTPNCFSYKLRDQESEPPFRLGSGEHIVVVFDITETTWQNVENWGREGEYSAKEQGAKEEVSDEQVLEVDNAVYFQMLLSDGSLKEESIDIATAVYSLSQQDKSASLLNYYLDDEPKIVLNSNGWLQKIWEVYEASIKTDCDSAV